MSFSVSPLHLLIIVLAAILKNVAALSLAIVEAKSDLPAKKLSLIHNQ